MDFILSKEYAWLMLSALLLAVWGAVYVFLRTEAQRREMLSVSAWTSLLGLTEPIFVPEYWNPYSLFDLARRTGFDIESLLFTFAVGGIVVAAYEAIFGGSHIRMSHEEKSMPRHRWHVAALSAAPLAFIALLLAAPFNPIYSAALALIAGFFATLLCRPDLFSKMAASGVIFTIIYFAVFSLFDVIYAGYVQEVWNLGELSGWFVGTVPIEELLFAFTFGLYWSSIYEHFTWRKVRV